MLEERKHWRPRPSLTHIGQDASVLENLDSVLVRADVINELDFKAHIDPVAG